jgi:hypothetical protein
VDVDEAGVPLDLEIEINQHVYRLFDLIPAEIQLIEASTKYPYGEVQAGETTKVCETFVVWQLL